MKIHTIRIKYKFHKDWTWFEALPYRTFEPNKYSPDIMFYPTSECIVEVGTATLAFFKKADLKLIIRPPRDPSYRMII